MYNPEADNGNDHSDDDEADESNDRVARERAANYTEPLANQAYRRSEPHTQGALCRPKRHRESRARACRVNK